MVVPSCGFVDTYVSVRGFTVVKDDSFVSVLPSSPVAVATSLYALEYPSGSVFVHCVDSGFIFPSTTLPSGLVSLTSVSFPSAAVAMTGSPGDTSAAPLFSASVNVTGLGGGGGGALD